MNIIFLGAPGSGKGTQASLLSKKLNIPQISTGEILRSEIGLGSELGIMVKSCVDSGLLVPDEVVTAIVKTSIAKPPCQDGFILDGFPRSLNQAVILAEMIANINKKIDIVFNFEVSDDVLIKRISGRFFCKNCSVGYNRYFKPTLKVDVCDNCQSRDFESRGDDNEVAVSSRLKVHHNAICEVVKFYEKHDLLVAVNAEEKVDAIFDHVMSAIRDAQQS